VVKKNSWDFLADRDSISKGNEKTKSWSLEHPAGRSPNAAICLGSSRFGNGAFTSSRLGRLYSKVPYKPGAGGELGGAVLSRSILSG
jgi:hypothetical protein